MNNQPDNPSAFPSPECITDFDDAGRPYTKYGIESTAGMTLRDWFAGQIVAGIGLNCGDGCDGYMNQRAKVAYQFADAMLTARAAQEKAEGAK